MSSADESPPGDPKAKPQLVKVGARGGIVTKGFVLTISDNVKPGGKGKP